MKVHYSPYFDHSPFIHFQKRNNFLFNEQIVGDKGLLAQLELRSGLVCRVLSAVEREANYYNALKRVVDRRPGSFISRSFEMDEYGVASELLRWRDELVLAGWTPQVKGVSEKLDLVAEVEDSARENGINIKGESDRWKDVFESEALFLGKDDELVIYFPENLLPPWMAQFFKRLYDRGMNCAYQKELQPIAPENTNLYTLQKVLLNPDAPVGHWLNEEDNDSLRIIHFERDDRALEYLVSRPADGKKVYINSDSRNFDNLGRVFNKPLSGASLVNASPEVVQLFKLGLSLFIKPFNIHNLLSYLQVHVHPLPSRLRYQLIRVIIDEGGILNRKWAKVIHDFITAENPKEAKKRKEKLLFLPVSTNLSEEINVQALEAYIVQLRIWAQQQRHVRERGSGSLLVEALSSLVDLCNAFRVILSGQSEETVSSDRLKSWILSIYRPSGYTYTTPQAGSEFVIRAPAAMLDPAEEVVWMDCYNGTPKAAYYRFLTHEEWGLLEGKGLRLWREEDQVKGQLFAQERAILQCRHRCTLIVSNKSRGKSVSQHPLVTRLYTQFNNVDRIVTNNPQPSGQIEMIMQQSLPQVPLSIELGKKDLFKVREKESYSSLSSLIQNPLDYVFNYQLRFSHPGVNELSNEKRSMGNVAHLFVEELVNDAQNSLEEMRQLISKEFSDRFLRAVMHKGAILLLEENNILRIRFSNLLEISVESLLDLIESNGLEVEGVEVKESCRQDSLFELEANIDLLLKDKNGAPVIFDMKWTGSQSKYRRWIKTNRALQLELYRKVLDQARQSHTSAVAYYNLKEGRLITASNLSGSQVVKVEPDNHDDIFAQAINGWQYRWKQLQKGVVEVGEGLELKDLEYDAHREKENLYPLDGVNPLNKLKASNLYSNFKTFKGGLR